jgi:hypothetical protein
MRFFFWGQIMMTYDEILALGNTKTEEEHQLQLHTDRKQEASVKIYVIRVLEIEYDGQEFRYHQLETNEHYGIFPSLPSMLGHIHDKMLEDVAEAITRQTH